jgi:TPR repeat protein
MYGMGKGIPKDLAEAVRLYRLAADQGHVWRI